MDPLFLTQSFWTPFAGVQRPEGLQRLMTLILIDLSKVTTQGDIGWQTFGKICGHKVGGNLDAKANQGAKATGSKDPWQNSGQTCGTNLGGKNASGKVGVWGLCSKKICQKPEEQTQIILARM